jgi:hypothetical protein
MNSQNSRFITPPDILEKSHNHTVILVNPSAADIEAVGYFCKTSRKDYDIYLYDSSDNNHWFEQIGSVADYILTSGQDNLLDYFKMVDRKE